MSTIRGRVWKFGDDVNTDVMAPGPYLDKGIEELKKHCLETLDPSFPKQVKPGDIVVGGANFGCGSSREHAPSALKALGVGAIIAESYGRIFFRNAIAIGLPAVLCKGISKACQAGDQLELRQEEGMLLNLTSGQKLAIDPLSPDMLRVLSAGGIVPLLKAIAAGQTAGP